MHTLKIAIITILVALSVGTNYALVSFQNVKLMDFITFVGGFLFGPLTGVLVGVFSWSIYGVLNPYGFVPQIWLATMLSEAIYGVAGGFLRKAHVDFKISLRHTIFMGEVGFLLTLLYDLLTNVAFAEVLGQNILVAIAVGAPFTLTHEISNALLFGTCSIPLISALRTTGVCKVANPTE
jgi:uncharacterized membrane protein